MKAVRLVLAISLPAFLACAGKGEKENEVSNPTAPVDFIKIAPASFYVSVQPDPGVYPAQQVVGSAPRCYRVSSLEGWKKLGFREPTPASPNPSPEEKAVRELDFARHDVVLLTMGVQGTTGYAMTLEQVEKAGEAVRFILKTKRPRPTDVVGEALTEPSVMIRVAKLPKPARLGMVMDNTDVACEIHELE